MPSVGSIPFMEGTKVLGLADVRARLQELPKRIALNVVRRGLLAGGGVLRDEARRLVPVRTGALRKSIIARTNRRKSSRTLVFAEVVIDNKIFSYGLPNKRTGARRLKSAKRRKGDTIKGKIYPRNYAHLVEFGTRPHSLGKGSRLRVLRKVAGIQLQSQHGRMHPGARPKPYLRPAFASKAEAAIDAIKNTIRREIDVEVTKLASKKGAAA